MSEPVLPAWAEVGEKRRAHIARVTALLDRWAAQLRLAPEEAQAWHDAGRWHDALRDASSETLRALADEPDRPVETLHGPAAAVRLQRREAPLQVIAVMGVIFAERQLVVL